MNASINKYYKEQISELRYMPTKNPKYYWKFINQIREPLNKLEPFNRISFKSLPKGK